MNKKITFSFVIGLLLVAFCLAGCGGGGGSKGEGLAGKSGVTITVLPDTEFQADPLTMPGLSRVLATNSEQQIAAKLDKGATIEAFDFETRHPLGKTTVGDDGKGTLTLPADGKTVLIIVTGKRDGKDYRLSAIIPFVSEPRNYYVGPAETLAAEAIAQKFYGATGIDEQTWRDVLEKAEGVLGDEEEVDISIGGGFVTNTAFGTSGSIDAEKAAEIISMVNGITIDSKLIKAKNTVNMINRAAVPMQDLLDQEYLGVHEVAAETYAGIQNTGLSEYFAKYGLLSDRVDEMLLPLLDTFEYDGDSEATLNDLTIGKKYKIANVDYWRWTVEEIAGGTAGVITIIKENPGDTLTVTAKKVGDNWQLKQTSSADAQLNYTASAPLDIEDYSGNVSIYLKDKDITDPITFNGSISGKEVGDNKAQVVFNGTLSSKEVTVKAKVTAVVTVVSDSELKMKIALDNIEAKYKAGDLEARVVGAANADLEMSVGDWVSNLPISINVNNLKADVTASGKKSSFNLTGKVDFVTVDKGDIWFTKIVPVKIETTSFTASLNDGSLFVKGSLSGAGEVKSVNGEDKVFPTKFSLTNAEYTRKDNTSLMGSFVGEWKNPGVDLSANHINGTINVDARLQRAGYEDLTVDLKLTADGAGNVALVVNRLGWQNSYFTGSGAAVMSAGYNPDTANLTLTSNTEVVIEFTDKDMNGSVKVAGEQQGVIEKEGKVVKVRFTDGKFLGLIGNLEL